MQEAIAEARVAYANGEVPIGAVLVVEKEVVACGHNQVEALQDATAHAEMVCIRNAAKSLGNWRLNGSVLYTTLEPCLMCSGAAILSRVGKIVWCAKDFRHGGVESIHTVFDQKHPIHHVEIERDARYEEEVAGMLKDFFRQRRESGKRDL